MHSKYNTDTPLHVLCDLQTSLTSVVDRGLRAGPRVEPGGPAGLSGRTRAGARRGLSGGGRRSDH